MSDDAVADRLLASVFDEVALVVPVEQSAPATPAEEFETVSDRMIEFGLVALSSGIVGFVVGAAVATITIAQRWGLGR